MNSRTVVLHYTPPSASGGVEAILSDALCLARRIELPILLVSGLPKYGEHHGLITETIPLLNASSSEVMLANASASRGDMKLTLQIAALIRNRLRQVIRCGDMIHAHNLACNTFNVPLLIAMYELLQFDTSLRMAAWSWDPVWISRSDLEFPSTFPFSLIRIPWPRTHYLVATEERYRAFLDQPAFSPENVSLICPYIEPTRVFRLSERLFRFLDERNVFSSDLLIVYPCRLGRRKHIERALDAVVEIMRSGAVCKLVLTAFVSPHRPQESASYLKSLRNRVSELGIERHVFFLSDLGRPGSNEPTHEEVLSLMGLADCVISTSNDEGFGLALLEGALLNAQVVAPMGRSSAILNAPRLLAFEASATAAEIARLISKSLPESISRHLLFKQFSNQSFWQSTIALLENRIPLSKLDEL